MRWPFKLSVFRYAVEYLPGELNAWARMFTRWAVNPKKAVNSSMGYKIKYLMLAPINVGMDPKINWPSRDEIIRSQSKSKLNPPESFEKIKDGIRYEQNRLCSFLEASSRSDPVTHSIYKLASSPNFSVRLGETREPENTLTTTDQLACSIHPPTGYVWFASTMEATAEVVAKVLIRWFASFGVVEQWISDRGTHFKNELVRLLR